MKWEKFVDIPLSSCQFKTSQLWLYEKYGIFAHNDAQFIDTK